MSPLWNWKIWNCARYLRTPPKCPLFCMFVQRNTSHKLKVNDFNLYNDKAVLVNMLKILFQFSKRKRTRLIVLRCLVNKNVHHDGLVSSLLAECQLLFSLVHCMNNTAFQWLMQIEIALFCKLLFRNSTDISVSR